MGDMFIVCLCRLVYVYEYIDVCVCVSVCVRDDRAGNTVRCVLGERRCSLRGVEEGG